MPQLVQWDSFYVIVGSAAGALIGLQFVVLTLIADRPKITHSTEAGAAFATPTIVHFAVTLLLSAMLRIPWQTIGGLAISWGVIGFGGIGYTISVAQHIRGQGIYRPEFADWLFYFLFPFVAYATLAVAAFTASSHVRGALFGVAGAALVLLFIGIHNAWDSVSYHVFTYKPNASSEQNQHASPAKEALIESAKDGGLQKYDD